MKLFKIILLSISLSLVLCSCQSTKTESFSTQRGAKELTVEQVADQPTPTEEITTQEETEDIITTTEITTETVARSPSGPTTIDNTYDPRSIDYLIVVNLETRMLTLFYNQEKMLAFPVGPGILDSNNVSITPTGRFSILNKCYNIDYKGSAGFKEGGDPENPYGHYWMAIGNIGTSVYGIHGTSIKWEDSIGGYVSAGCIRMHNWDVPVLFDNIYVGTEVLIGYPELLTELGAIGFE